MLLENKIALVTGASRGIGRAAARALASQGAYVIFNYNGSLEQAQSALNEVKAKGGDGMLYQCDVADFNTVETMIKDIIKQKGRIDILVNNAGITRDNLLMKMSEEDYDKVLDINLKGYFNTIRHLSRYMLKQRSGRIINISSVSGVIGLAGQANYSAAKAGVIGLTKSAARELGSRGITVNGIAPGFIETDMTAELPEKLRQEAASKIALGRFGQTENIADAVVFLASDKAGYITGQCISIDGGM